MSFIRQRIQEFPQGHNSGTRSLIANIDGLRHGGKREAAGGFRTQVVGCFCSVSQCFRDECRVLAATEPLFTRLYPSASPPQRAELQFHRDS